MPIFYFVKKKEKNLKKGDESKLMSKELGDM